ncbi:HK97 family phage prohead protease [Arthrobacter sp. M-10]|uniref:HK97 family phage prohead protease n=1 Tax=Arthrobacter sp. M-10 TaxID=3233037 RepID=UPI003F93BB92
MTEVRKINKLFNIDIKSVDEQARTITFCFSDDQPDRQGEIVDQASWDVKNYMNNPLILWGHDASENENVLGQGISLDLNNNGKSYITAQFDDAQTNPKADTIFRQLVKRTLRCVSAGFINHTWDMQDDVPVLKDNELLEVSVVAIPANPRAIALAYKEGTINKKDATWLMDSMRKEADLLEVQLKEQITGGEENMDEVKSQLAAALDAMTKIAETVNDIKAENAELKAKFEEQWPVETDEQRAEREAKEAEDAKAADDAKAAADAEVAKKAEEEAQAEKDRLAAEEAAKAEPELTDELKTQIDAQLEETLAVAA